MTLRFGEFALPSHWFSDVFGPDGPQLADQYAELFQGFESATVREFRSAIAIDSARVETKLVRTNAEPSQKLPAPSLVPLPPVQHFQIRYLSGPNIVIGDENRTELITPGHDNSWVDSFVYVDGAFRFFGGGHYPFWDPCSKDGPLPGGNLIERVEPIYPQEAKRKHLEDSVEMRITIAKDGSVKEVKVKRGSPLLAEAARQAVSQWRYEPFMKCGQAEETQTTVFLHLP